MTASTLRYALRRAPLCAAAALVAMTTASSAAAKTDPRFHHAGAHQRASASERLLLADMDEMGMPGGHGSGQMGGGSSGAPHPDTNAKDAPGGSPVHPHAAGDSGMDKHMEEMHQHMKEMHPDMKSGGHPTDSPDKAKPAGAADPAPMDHM